MLGAVNISVLSKEPPKTWSGRKEAGLVGIPSCILPKMRCPRHHRVRPGCLPAQDLVAVVHMAFSVALPKMPDAGKKQNCHWKQSTIGRGFPQADKIFLEVAKLGDQSAEDYRTVKPIRALETSDRRGLWVLPRSFVFKDLSCPVETEL